ncbi:MAG: phosphotransferase [Alphaproteobacteria bacterium]|nr:phosphotransferase [Alphaproteobacteria bacterium]
MTRTAAWSETGSTLECLRDLAHRSLGRWELPSPISVTLVNVSENVTWRLDGPSGERWILRIHRDGYHSRDGIRTELVWLHALQNDIGIVTPQAIAGVDGDEIQTDHVSGLASPRNMVLFEFIDGVEPSMDADLAEPFRRLGDVSARLHLHAMTWQRPAFFERLNWDAAGVFGPLPNWGDWRDGPLDDTHQRSFLEGVEEKVLERLGAYGRTPERFGLAHCDLRLGNLLLVGDETRVIDFDDCGLSWFLYDLASALTLIDNLDTTGDLLAAWFAGYRAVRVLDEDDMAIIPSLVMMRRFAILAWFGSHAETELAAENREGYAAATCAMGEAFLSRSGDGDGHLPWL